MSEADNKIAPHPVLSEYYHSEQDRRERVNEMFDASAEHYDWINSVMSLGSGERYRKQALTKIGFEPGMTVFYVFSAVSTVPHPEPSVSKARISSR